MIGWKAYPNPIKEGVIKIEYKISERSEVRIRIYDIKGEEEREYKVGVREIGKNKEEIEVEGLSSGVYIYEIEAKSERSGKKDEARGRIVVIRLENKRGRSAKI